MKKIIITGGGTAGHIMPAIALLPYLNEYEIHFIGGNSKLENTILKPLNINYHYTDVVKFDRGNLFKNFLLPIKLSKAVKEAKIILKKLDPQLIFCKGGYCALPTAMAGISLKIPIIVHESDKSLGLANKLVAPKAKAIIAPFDCAKKRYYTLPNPIREQIFNGDKTKIIKELSLDDSKLTLLILGGSLGAVAINKAVEASLPNLVGKFNIIHIVGKNNLSHNKTKNYFQFEYVSNIEDYYDLADIVITRGGASAVAEINALGKKMLIIPLPTDNSRGDQIDNAKFYKQKNCAIVLLQEDLNDVTLVKSINVLLNSPQPTSLYDVDTPKNIVKIINSIINNQN
ncbi:MAG: UDP-N-acetylglucosamine--N-acetylmuramyl-(pentapeptide) pyrophosphoryl-undecaprenol N-acetylglucosamine transferase [Clostridia bacterium]